MTQSSIVLHGTALSGHVHRVQLLLAMLELPYDFVEADAMVRAGGAFRKLNPLGQIPVLQDGDLVIADSNAVLVYLAKRYGAGTPWLPEDAAGAAYVQRWLSISAGEVRFGPAHARVIMLFKAAGNHATACAIAAKLLGVMEGHLAERPYLATEHATIADLACYSYVAHAPEGGIGLDPYPAVRAWLARIEALPRFRPMPASALPKTA